jgi:hypothetical protein
LGHFFLFDFWLDFVLRVEADPVAWLAVREGGLGGGKAGFLGLHLKEYRKRLQR